MSGLRIRTGDTAGPEVVPEHVDKLPKVSGPVHPRLKAAQEAVASDDPMGILEALAWWQEAVYRMKLTGPDLSQHDAVNISQELDLILLSILGYVQGKRKPCDEVKK